MLMNVAATPGHVCPGIRIHVIDIVQPPGISMPPIADMDADHIVVNVALAAKSNAETPTKTVCVVDMALLPSSAVPLWRVSRCSAFADGREIDLAAGRERVGVTSVAGFRSRSWCRWTH
jgi:hypothetical protein